jgi:hypothetical protein
MIEEFVDLIPKELLYKSGWAFFSGRRAFSELSDLYILASNPGGNPDDSPEATVAKNVHRVLCKVPENWSAYRDDCWGPNCTKNRLQRGVLHLFDRLKLDAGEIPASEVVFLCSKSLAEIPFERLAEQCWPFHRAVIDRLGVKVVVCIGKRAGKFVRHQINANKPIDWFSERNKRGWESHSHKSACGIIVVTLTHASQVDWTNRASDPTWLVIRALIKSDLKYKSRYLADILNFKPIRIKGEMISDTVIRDRADRV